VNGTRESASRSPILATANRPEFLDTSTRADVGQGSALGAEPRGRRFYRLDDVRPRIARGLDAQADEALIAKVKTLRSSPTGKRS